MLPTHKATLYGLVLYPQNKDLKLKHTYLHEPHPGQLVLLQHRFPTCQGVPSPIDCLLPYVGPRQLVGRGSLDPVRVVLGVSIWIVEDTPWKG